MPLNRKQIALLHVAKSKLGLSEAEYTAAHCTCRQGGDDRAERFAH